MNARHAASLAEQRQSIRELLSAQRRQIARALAPDVSTGSHYPRSITMRLLSRRPVVLLARVAALVTTSRMVGSVPAALIVAHLLRAAIAAYTTKPHDD
jgi:hypothetical protein